MTEKIFLTLTIPDDLIGTRLDQALAKLLSDFSRTEIQEWIKNGNVTVNNQHVKAKEKMFGGETVIIDAMRKTQPVWQPQAIQLDIIYEDEALLVINKPPGMVVHPAPGNPDNTLLNAILHHAPDLAPLPRVGIIHRLDKNTSGLLVIAKTHAALMNLSKQMKSRRISRIYQAIVCGTLLSGGTIEAPVGRNPVQRKRMAVIETGKPAVTHYRVIEKYRAHTRLKIQLETGRTHQIRVHMAHLRYPIFGDQTYGGRLQLPRGASPELITTLREFKRQALHAKELGLTHPLTNKPITWQAPLPLDMQNLANVLHQDAELNKDSFE